MTSLEPMKFYFTFLRSSHPYNVKYLFNIIYLPNSCKASMELFFLPSNDQLTSEVDSRNVSVNFVKIEGRYNKLNDLNLCKLSI